MTPGLRYRRLIQSGFQQLIRLLELIGIQPLHRPRQAPRPDHTRQIPLQLHRHRHRLPALGRLMQSQLIQAIDLTRQQRCIEGDRVTGHQTAQRQGRLPMIQAAAARQRSSSHCRRSHQPWSCSG